MSRIDFVSASAPREKEHLHKNGLTQPVIKSPVLGVQLISRGRLQGFLLIGYKGEVMKTLQVAVGGLYVGCGVAEAPTRLSLTSLSLSGRMKGEELGETVCDRKRIIQMAVYPEGHPQIVVNCKAYM